MRREVQRIRATLAALVLCGAALAAPARAQDSLEDVLQGFEDDDLTYEAGPADEAPPVEPRAWDLGGSLALSSSYAYHGHRSSTGTDYTGLTRLRLDLDLQLDLRLGDRWRGRLAGFGFYDLAYRVRGRDRFRDEVLDVHEWEVDFKEVWVQGPLLRNLDVKLGRQVVNWGRSETLRVLDVLNPVDNREPGLVDLEDLRRPVGMLRLDWYLGDWSVTAIAIPEIRFDENPAFGSDFFPVISVPFALPPVVSIPGLEFEDAPLPPGLQVSMPLRVPASLVELPPEREPDDFADSEFALALTGIFRGWDVSFHAARVWNDLPRFGLESSGPGPFPRLVLEHDRLFLAGAGANFTTGSWLFKGELAWIDGFQFTDISNPLRPRTVEKARIDALLGVEYYGLANTTIAFEVVDRHLLDFESFMDDSPSQRRDAVQLSLRVTRDLLRSRLQLGGLFVGYGYRAQDGSLLRLWADYDLRDGLGVEAGVLLFQGGDLPALDSISDNDRVYVRLRYSF